MTDKIKAYLTAWLIKFGTEWVSWSDLQFEELSLWMLVERGYLDRGKRFYTDAEFLMYRLTQKAIELIKENDNDHDDTGADSNQG